MKLRAPAIIGIVILVVGVIVIVAIQLFGWGRGADTPRGATVTGVVGSEKMAFFQDARVQEVFAEHGLRVEVSSSGSWRMAELADLNTKDFAFPASEVAAANIRTKVAGSIAMHQPFFSPMAIATFEPIMQLLQAAGVASKDASGTWILDMAAYLDLVAQDTRWNELPGAAATYNSPRSVLITSTDIRSSNSASQYLALAAYAASGNNVITSRAQADALLPQLSRLFLAQGYAGASSAAPFDDYLSQGMSAVPMVMMYEGQFMEEELKENSRIRENMVLAYPSPTIFSKHSGVTFTENGERVMELLATDPDLAELLAEHGFRPTGTHSGVFAEVLETHGLAGSYLATDAMVNLASEPSYEVMDYLLGRISAEYDLATGGGAPLETTEAPSPEPSETTPETPTPTPSEDAP